MAKFIIGFLLLLSGINSQATNYYFSKQSGASNANAGTQASPFLNFSRVNTLSLNPGDSLLLRAGDVFFENTVITISQTVVISRYGTGPKPVVSGMQQLDFWSNEGGNIWSANLNAGNRAPVVALNNKLANPARYPNTDGNWQRISSYTNSGSLVTLNGNLSSSTVNFTGAQVCVMVREWIMNKGRVASHSGNNVTFYNNVLDNGGQFLPEQQNGFAYFFMNHPAAMDVPGEYYYDSAVNKLKLVSLTTPSNVRAAIIDRLININANNVRIINVDFEGAKNEVIYSADKQYQFIKGCDVSFGGKEGINLYQTYSPTIDSCTFNYNSNRSIQAIQIFGQIRARVTNNRIKNNGMILGLGVSDNKSYEGIYVYGDSADIKFNELDSIGYNGIDFGGSFVHTDSNHVKNSMYWFTDGGGIYTSGDGHDDETGWSMNNNIVIGGRGYRFGTYGDPARAFGNYLDEEKMRGEVLRNTVSDFYEGGFYSHKADSTELGDNKYVLNKGSQIRIFQDDGSQPIRWVKAYRNRLFAGPGYYTYEFGQNPVPALDSFFRQLNNNTLSRPSNEANSIHVINNFYAYTPGDNFYSLATWKAAKASAAFTPYDANSTLAPARFGAVSPRLEYNASKVPRVLNFDTAQFDISGTRYVSAATIQPYSSLFLAADTTSLKPSVSAGADKTVQLPTTVSAFTGSAADADGAIVSYAWTQLSGTAAAIQTPAAASTNISGLSTAGQRTFQLAATDNYGYTRYDTVAVQVVSVNAAPVSSAGADQVVNTNTAFTAGSGTDSDGTVTTYAWTQISGPNTAAISAANASQTFFTSLVYGTYVFRLTVTDNAGGQGSDDVTVRYNRPPNVNAGADISVTLPVNSVTLSGSFSDLDGTATITWAKLSGPTATLANTATATPTASALLEGTYVFRATASDNNGAVSTDDVTVVVSPVIVIVPPQAQPFKLQGRIKLVEKP